MNQKITLNGNVRLENSEEDFFLKLEIDPTDGNSLWIHIPHSKKFTHADSLKFAHCKMDDGSFWSCLDLVLFSTQVSIPGHTILEYEALWAVKNPVCNSKDELQIYEAGVHIEGLEAWVNKYGFYNTDYNPEEGAASTHYKKPDDFVLLEIEGEIKVIANYIVEWRQMFSKKSFIVEPRLELHFEFLESTKPNISDATNYINRFINFFNVVWLCHPLKLKYTVSLKDEKTGEMFTGNVFYRQRKAKHILSESFEHFALIKFKDIDKEIISLLKNWMILSTQIEPVINLVIEYRLEGNNLTTNSLLNLTQSLETFHRRLRYNEVLPKEAFDQKKKRILNSLAPEDSIWLKDKIGYANEPTLGNRIDDIIEEFSGGLISLIMNDKKKFKKAIVDNRNYFTHFDKRYEEKNKILTINNVFVLNEKIHVLLILLLLKEIKVAPELLIEGLKRNKDRMAALRYENMALFKFMI